VKRGEEAFRINMSGNRRERIKIKEVFHINHVSKLKLNIDQIF
jgi:hypothetical protein